MLEKLEPGDQVAFGLEAQLGIRKELRLFFPGVPHRIAPLRSPQKSNFNASSFFFSVVKMEFLRVDASEKSEEGKNKKNENNLLLQ